MMTRESLILALQGGMLIGLAATLLLLLIGRISGISGIAGTLLRLQPGWHWRVTFIAGLVGGGILVPLVSGNAYNPQLGGSTVLWIIAGLLVGFGSRLGSGCTSGHGICGLSRLSLRSLAAVALFMVVAIVTATLYALVTGGNA